MGNERDNANKTANHPDDANQVWAVVCNELEAQISGRDFRSWIVRLLVQTGPDHRVYLIAPNGFTRDWIQENLFSGICDLWQRHDPLDRNMTLQIGSPGFKPDEPTTCEEPVLLASPAAPVSRPVNFEKYLFETFIVGPSNDVAYAVAKQAARGPQDRYNPLFVHGGYGLGKTHLLRAIAHQAKIHSPSKRVLYLTAEEFVQNFLTSLRGAQTQDFKKKVRSLDLLLVDDMHFLAGKAATQEEFVHTICSLIESGAQVVLSADRPAGEIASLDDRLRSHLGGGVVCRIAPPGFALRRQILEQQIEKLHEEFEKLVFPESVVNFLAEKISTSPRELLGALNMVISGTALVGRTVTLDAAEDILSDVVRATRIRISVAEIQKGTASWFGLTKEDLLSRRKTRNIVRPRQIAMYLAKQLTSSSLPMIGSRFDDRDHTTVIHAVKTISRLMSQDSSFADEVEGLRRSLTKVQS